MVREFKFKGYSADQVQKISIETFMPLLNSRQRRSLDKRLSTYMNDEKRKFREELKLSRDGKLKSPLKTHLRDMIILPDMIGLTVLVHNGKEFVSLVIKQKWLVIILANTLLLIKEFSMGTWSWFITFSLVCPIKVI